MLLKGSESISFKAVDTEILGQKPMIWHSTKSRLLNMVRTFLSIIYSMHLELGQLKLD